MEEILAIIGRDIKKKGGGGNEYKHISSENIDS